MKVWLRLNSLMCYVSCCCAFTMRVTLYPFSATKRSKTESMYPFSLVGRNIVTACFTHRHAEGVPIVAIEFVRSLFQRRVNNQLITSPMVTSFLSRIADRMAVVHSVRQTCVDKAKEERKCNSSCSTDTAQRLIFGHK